MSEASDLTARVATVCPAFAAGKVPLGQALPYAVVHGGSSTPESRALDGVSASRWRMFMVMLVSNNSGGCATLAGKVVDVVDGAVDSRAPWTVESVSEPIDDTSTPGETYWTSTVEVHHHT